MIIPDYSSYHVFLGPDRKPGPSASVPGNPMMDTDHFRNWIVAMRSRKPGDLLAEIEEGHRSSALAHLANIVYRTGRTLTFDPKTEQFAAHPEADKLLTRPYRTALRRAGSGIEDCRRGENKNKDQTMSEHPHNYPKLHNAAWPGLVGKGNGGEPPIDLDTMLNLTRDAEVDGVRFDGFDVFLYHPHFNIDGGDEETKRLADKARTRNLEVGSVVAPVYPGTGGGLPIGGKADREKFLDQIHKVCHVGQRLRELGVRPNGVVRIDSACGVGQWCEDPKGNQRRIADTFREACKIAEDHDERLAAEGEICWGGMHSWRRMIELLEMVDRPQTLGFQADMSHTLLYLMGYNAPEDAPVAAGFRLAGQGPLRRSLRQAHRRVAPVDDRLPRGPERRHGPRLGLARQDGPTLPGQRPERQAGHCPLAGFWLRDAKGQLTKRFRHVCWDGCMFPNATMMRRETWNDILRAMVGVRDAHGWQE